MGRPCPGSFVGAEKRDKIRAAFGDWISVFGRVLQSDRLPVKPVWFQHFQNLCPPEVQREKCPKTTSLAEGKVKIIWLQTGLTANRRFAYSWYLSRDLKGKLKNPSKGIKVLKEWPYMPTLPSSRRKKNDILLILLPINNLSACMELRVGHQYFIGEMSGATAITLERLHLRNFRRGPIRINGGKT